MNKKTDYAILILRVNGSIDVFYYNSPMDLKRAYDDGINELRSGEVIRMSAFNKTVATHDKRD